ncbi:MAG: zf-HC2 domain-containing protein [Candidatus Theseobacter exili]|nr:zf-HC2 domain-containing protein [Candidatus Theseobacter exili]
MKTANDNFYTCSNFQQSLSLFIDGELDDVLSAKFLAHSESCKACNNSLKEFQRLRTLLKNLSPVTVSPEQDFRLKASIRLENNHLRSPLYQFKLFFRENAYTFVTVPAVALIIVVGMFNYVGIEGNNMQTEITENYSNSITSGPPVTIEETPGEHINYVLDSVTPLDVESGIFLNEQNKISQTTSTENNIKLVNF